MYEVTTADNPSICLGMEGICNGLIAISDW